MKPKIDPETPSTEIGKEKDYEPLTRPQCSASIVVGSLLVIAAVLLFLFPPTRSSSTFTVKAGSREAAESSNPAEPTTIAVALLTSGALLLFYGINGRVVTAFAAGPISGDTKKGGDRSVTLRADKANADDAVHPIARPEPASIPKLTEMVAKSDIRTATPLPGQIDPNTIAELPAKLRGTDDENRSRAVLASLLWDMMPGDKRPPGPRISLEPPSEREVRPGTVIRFDPSRLRSPRSVYFFSHDLMLCFSALLCGSNRGTIWHTANCASVHLNGMGFSGTEFAAQIEQIKIDCAPNTSAGLTEEQRMRLAGEVFRLARAVGNIIEDFDRSSPKTRIVG